MHEKNVTFNLLYIYGFQQLFLPLHIIIRRHGCNSTPCFDVGAGELDTANCLGLGPEPGMSYVKPCAD